MAGRPPDPGAPTSVQVGTVLAGRYRLDRPLAVGGMARVWEAHDEVLGRPVAVKVLLDHLGADDSFVARFRAEALAAARLAHPSVVSVYDTCSGDGVEAIVMELIDGTTLRQRIDAGDLDLRSAARIGSRVAEALAVAHKAGIVHRDAQAGQRAAGHQREGRGHRLRHRQGVRGRRPDHRPADARHGQVPGPGAGRGAPGRRPGRRLRPRRGPVRDDHGAGPVPGRHGGGHRTGPAPPAAPAVADPTPRRPRRLRRGGRPHPGPRRRRPLARRGEPRPRPGRPGRGAGTSPAPGAPAPPAHPGPRPASAPNAPKATAAASPPPRERPAADPSPIAASDRAEPAATPRHGRRTPLPLVVLVLVAIGLISVLAWRSIDGSGGEAVDVQATAFDPFGTEGENDDEAARATDGDPSTAWQTERYDDPDVAALKGGVGLLLDTGEARDLRRVEVASVSTAWAATIYVVDAPPEGPVDDWGEPVASAEQIDGAWDADLGGAHGRMVLLWITRTGDDGRVTISDVIVEATT